MPRSGGPPSKEVQTDARGYRRIPFGYRGIRTVSAPTVGRIHRGYRADTARIQSGYRGYRRIQADTAVSERYPPVSACIRRVDLIFPFYFDLIFVAASTFKPSTRRAVLFMAAASAEATPTQQEASLVPADAFLVDDSQAGRCSKCGVELTQAEDIAAQKHMSLLATCKSCHALTCLITRNASDVMKGLTGEEQVQFFRRMGEMRKAAGGLLRWKMVRPQLIESLTKQAITECRDGVGGSFEPLEFYRLKGYDVGAIEQQCECEDHPVLGKTYLLKTRRIDETSITRDIEAKVAQAEMEVRRRHLPVQQPARTATKTRAAQDAVMLTDEEKALAKSLEGLVDLVSDDEEHVLTKRPRGSGRAGSTKAEEKKVEKEKQKVAAKMVLLAHKAMVTLKPVADKMIKADEQATKTNLYDEMDSDTRELWQAGFKEAQEAMAKVLAALDKSKKEPLTQDDLPFSVDKDVTLLVKASRSAMESLNHCKAQRAKDKKAEKKAEKGGA